MPTIGSLNTSLTLESQQFMVGLRRAAEQTQTSVSKIERSFSQLKGAAVGLAGALALDAAIGAAGRALDYASSLGEVAQQLGVTTKDLQVYRFAASQAGIEQEAMDKSLAKLTLSLGQARAGAKKPADAFRELGALIKTDIVASSRTAGDALPLIAEAMGKIESPADRARIGVSLFGKSFQQLDTLLASGRGQIDELREAAERLGLVLDDKLIQQADDAADKLGAMKQVLEAKIAGVVAANADSIVKLADSIGLLVTKLNDINRTNPEKLFTIIGALTGGRLGLAIGRAGGIPGAIAGGAIGAGIGATAGYVGGSLSGGREARIASLKRSLNKEGFLGVGRIGGPERARREAELKKLEREQAEESFRGRFGEGNLFLGNRSQSTAPSFGSVSAGASTPARSRGRSAGGGGSGGANRNEFGDFLNDTRFLARDLQPAGEVTFGSVTFTIDAETSDALRRIRELTQGGVDLSISADSIAEADERAQEYLRNYEDELRRIDQERVDRQGETTRELAGLYQSLFRDGTRGLWRDFKSIGLAVISEIAAKFMVATLAGKAFDLGGALTSSLTGLGFGGFFANGGSPPVGRVSVVGERGPELFVPRVPGRIIPNHALGGAQRVEIVDTTGLFETRVSRISAGVATPIAQGAGRAAMVGGASLARRQAAQAASRRLGR